MTDNEIIKALECCTYNITQEKCDECPLYGGHCTTELAKNAIDLINRQKAEIEKIETLEYYKKILDYYALQFGTVRDKQKVITEAKAEAVKKFADKVLLYIPNIEGDTTIKCVEEAIKQTLKETVGDADGFFSQKD